MTQPVCKLVHFYWTEGDSFSVLTLYDRSLEDATKLAETFGFKQSRWYNPWTWKNWIFVVK
jgi:hypothetical protein